MANTWINLGIVMALFACASCNDDKPRGPCLTPRRVRNCRARIKWAAPSARALRHHCRIWQNAAEADRPAEEARREPPLPERPFPKVGDVVPNDQAPLHGGWSYTGGGFFESTENGCCFDHYDQLEPDGPNVGQSLYVITEPTERNASGGSRRGRVALVFYVRLNALASTYCRIGERQAVVAFADENWRNGRAVCHRWQDVAGDKVGRQGSARLRPVGRR